VVHQLPPFLEKLKMPDPLSVAGLAVGIIALYSVCRDCYIYISDISSADKSKFYFVRELGIQESILKSWGFYWEIQRHQVAPSSSSQTQHEKLRLYLEKNLYKVGGVGNALFAIADTLSSKEKLAKKYELDISPKEQDLVNISPACERTPAH
jgi:hypothetical protein